MTGVEGRGPGRPRKVEVAQERRRRSDSSLTRMAQLKLSVPDKIAKANPGQSFRWVNDSGTRMFDLTQQDDWDKVDGVDPIPVGTDNFGKPILAHLCKKPTEFLEKDRQEMVDQTRETEKAIERGARAADDNRSDAESYVPSGNSIKADFTP